MLTSNSSLLKLLFHSNITLALIIIACIAMSFTVQLKLEHEVWSYLLSVHTSLSIFFSGYVAVGLVKFKRHHLWRLNPRYRINLLHASLIILACFYLAQFVTLSLHLSLVSTAFIYPITSGFCFAYYLLGNSFFKRLAFFLLGLVWTFLPDEAVASNWVLACNLALLTVTVFLYYQDKQPLGYSQQSTYMMNIFKNNVNLPFYYKWSAFLNRFIRRSLTKKNPQKNIHWLINLPHNRCGLMSVFYFLVILLLSFIGEKDEPYSVVFFCNLYVFTLVFNVLMESRQLLVNTKSVAHLWSQHARSNIKGKIIQSLDTTIIFNTALLSALVFGLVSITNAEISSHYFVASNLAIIAIGLAIYPLLLCFQWLKVSWQLILSIAIYGGLCYFVCEWLFEHLEQPSEAISLVASSEYYLILFGIIALRQLSLKIFQRSPIERMLKSD
ncbi:hypothetical protein [Aliikangiella sp. IMCC44632]